MRRTLNGGILMSRFIQACRRFFKEESAPRSLEYPILIALLAAAVIVDAISPGNEKDK